MSCTTTVRPTLRVISWNCRGASRDSKLWDYLLELDPDVAVLQDFRTVPDRVLQIYSHARNAYVPPTTGAPRHFTGIVIKGECTADISLPAPSSWVARELEILKQFFTAKAITLHNGISLKVISVYSPAIPIDRARLVGINTTGIQLPQNPDLWGTELLWASLRLMNITAEDPLIVAGDLNSSETFDSPKDRGNREIMKRMNALGLVECLRTHKGQLTPTFRTARGGYIAHQLDHLYVTGALLSNLACCDVGSADRVFGSAPSLSDHLPIVADFWVPL
jgi:exonuclease III